MPLDFVDRDLLVHRLSTRIKVAPPQKRLALLDSPAGTGKTYLIIKVCLELIEHTHGQEEQEPWKIIRLDFRDPSKRYGDRRDILEDIARQIVRDIQWDNIRDMVAQAGRKDQILVEQATSIPMADEERQALLRAVQKISPEDLGTIRQLIVDALDNVDLQELRQVKEFKDPDKQVAVLVAFILKKRAQAANRYPIPSNVLLVFDSLDALDDESLQDWITSQLALGLHDGLQTAFERFFVIVSGRFIEQSLPHAVQERYYTNFVLEPFIPEVVEDLIRQFGDRSFNRQHALVSRLGRKLTQICGGHPKVIKDIASILYEHPGHFSGLVHDPLQVGYWYNNPLIGIRPTLVDLRDEIINKTVEGISRQQKLVLELLSVFRKFNSATLETLRSKVRSCTNPPQALHQYGGCIGDDVDHLFNNLLETRLIWYGGVELFCSGRTLLNLMAAQMQEQEPALFCLLNHWAVEIFENWAKGCFADDPESLRPIPGDYQRLCICEWLFHRLRLVDHCESIAQAQDLGKAISQELDTVLDYVVPFPGQTDNSRLRQLIRDMGVAKDQQTNHLIWEIALEDPGRSDVIRAQILDTF